MHILKQNSYCQNESYKLMLENLVTDNFLWIVCSHNMRKSSNMSLKRSVSLLIQFTNRELLLCFVDNGSIMFSSTQARFVTVPELLGSSPNNNDVHKEKPSARENFDPLVSESNFLFELSLLQL